MPRRRRPTERDARAELQAWYLTSLRPKLARAATADVVEAAAADELDRQLRVFLDLPETAPERAA
ncbi:MAG TPA: hypothetical protein VFA19_06580 [Gaiellaceae bacterium]|nr:hypothetical protein [Gaiellaceae bacterium]